MCNALKYRTSEQKRKTNRLIHTLTDRHTLTDELNDLTATGGAYLGSVTFMCKGMRPLIKASASVSLDSQSQCQHGRARAAMHEN